MYDRQITKQGMAGMCVEWAGWESAVDVHMCTVKLTCIKNIQRLKMLDTCTVSNIQRLKMLHV